jgi:hypothetical protein
VLREDISSPNLIPFPFAFLTGVLFDAATRGRRGRRLLTGTDAAVLS